MPKVIVFLEEWQPGRAFNCATHSNIFASLFFRARARRTWTAIFRDQRTAGIWMTKGTFGRRQLGRELPPSPSPQRPTNGRSVRPSRFPEADARSSWAPTAAVRPKAAVPSAMGRCAAPRMEASVRACRRRPAYRSRVNPMRVNEATADPLGARHPKRRRCAIATCWSSPGFAW